MKPFFILLIILIFPLSNFAQSRYDYKDGYRFIRKSQRKLNHRHLRAAQRFINKAKKSNYGFCGTAWMEAFDCIHLLQVKVYIQQKQYDKVLSMLDSVKRFELGSFRGEGDSLEIATLILKFGKEKVKKSFKEITEVSLDTSGDYLFFPHFCVYLIDIDYHFCAPAHRNEGEPAIPPNASIAAFQKSVRHSRYWRLLE